MENLAGILFGTLFAVVLCGVLIAFLEIVQAFVRRGMVLFTIAMVFVGLGTLLLIAASTLPPSVATAPAIKTGSVFFLIALAATLAGAAMAWLRNFVDAI